MIAIALDPLEAAAAACAMPKHQGRRWAAAVSLSWASCSHRCSDGLQLALRCVQILAPHRLHLCDACVLFASFPSFAWRGLPRHHGFTLHLMLVSLLQQTGFLRSLFAIIAGHLRPGNIKHAIRVLASHCGARSSSFEALQRGGAPIVIRREHSLLPLWATLIGHATPRWRSMDWLGKCCRHYKFLLIFIIIIAQKTALTIDYKLN